MLSVDLLPTVESFFEPRLVLPEISSHKSVLCCSPAGDLALDLSLHCQGVKYIYESLEHRALFELKRSAFYDLKPTGRSTFLGFNPKGRRVFLFHQMKEKMPEEVQLWWLTREVLIRRGLIRSGRFDHIMNHWRRFCVFNFDRASFRQRLAFTALFRILKKFNSKIEIEQRFEAMSFERQKDWVEKGSTPAWVSATEPTHLVEPVTEGFGQYDSAYLYTPSLDLLKRIEGQIRPQGKIWCWSWIQPSENWSRVDDDCCSPLTPWLWFKVAGR
ncbi:MAG: hypothetical protein CMK59_15235 [Proteobacteria bacterium]|nr:hypothetical protein [Pseudomonadota bacterium]